MQQVVNDPLGFLDGPQGQALAANNGALAPIQGLLNQTQAIVDNPLGFAALPLSSGGYRSTNLENAALQQNVNRILSGGSFPGSDITTGVANTFHSLFPGGTDNLLNNLVGVGEGGRERCTRASTQRRHSRASSPRANSSRTPPRASNPYRSIIEDNISRSNQIAYMNQLNAAERAEPEREPARAGQLRIRFQLLRTSCHDD